MVTYLSFNQLIHNLNSFRTIFGDTIFFIITFKYISDGLATDNEMKIHKFAEDAMYQSILFNLLSTRIGIPEFIINRYRRSRRAAMRNAKIRLSNLKVGELTQVMRGKSKHIKH